MSWDVGKQLNKGTYTIEEILHRGDCGITYIARNNALNNHVVIKVPYSANKFLLDEREVNALAEISYDPEIHLNISNLKEFFREDESNCLVMEFIEGTNLERLIEQEQNGCLQTEVARQYISQIEKVLVVLHEDYKIVHRDIKPENIMIRLDGQAILIDFGIVGRIDPRTQTTMNLGTPTYAPWEQMSPNGSNDPIVDVHGIAATMYHVLTGQQPTCSVNRKLEPHRYPLIRPREHNRSIRHSLSKAIIKGMHINPKKRPQSMRKWIKLMRANEANSTPNLWERLINFFRR
jgi:serine/threonine protein kinase